MTKKEFIVEVYSADDGDILLWKAPNWLPPIPIKKELVRCKDCKHRPTIDDEHRRNGSDLKFPTHKCPCECYGDGYYSWMPKDDFYCGNGERKEE